MGSPKWLVALSAAAVVSAGLVAMMIWQQPSLVASYRELFGSSGAPAQAPDAARSILYEEDPADPQGRRLAGSAVWRTDTVPSGDGKPSEVVVRADVEIPDRQMIVAWMLRHDTDPSGPVSHTIEISFMLPPDFPGGGVLDVQGVGTKPEENAVAALLAGRATKVATGYFLIGLSATPAERDRNIRLLKDRPWFDIPIVYTNNRRAILAIEKGTHGDNAFKQAFAVWER